MVPPPPWTLGYADGAANQYRFEAGADLVRFTYRPVTPAESSSGRYHGGEPRAEGLALDDPRLVALWREVEALAADPAGHATARHKGDGALTVETGAGTRRFLVVRAALGRLEALLRDDFHAGPPR